MSCPHHQQHDKPEQACTLAEGLYFEMGGGVARIQEYKIEQAKVNPPTFTPDTMDVFCLFWKNTNNLTLKFHDHIFSKLHVKPLINFHLFTVLKVCQRVRLFGAQT